MPDPLAHALVAAPGATPARWMLFLHGIFGSGANWRTFARRFVAARPHWGAVLVDLRMHGASLDLPPPHTIAAAAHDLDGVAAVLPGPVAGILGHSFGGKVAMEYVLRHAARLEQAWILDSMPGPRPDARGSETTTGVLSLLERMGTHFPTREAFVAGVEQGGFSREIANWLAMNLRPTGTDYVFKLDLAAIRALLDDYFARDLWTVFEQPPGAVQLHVVIGGRSPVFDAHDRARMAHAALASGGRVVVHTLANAGHWVHVDDPEGLFAALVSAT